MDLTTTYYNTTTWNTTNFYEHNGSVHFTDVTFENVFVTLRNVQAVVTIFVNLLTILIIIRYKQLHTSSNVLFVSLAAADLITGLSTPVALTVIIIERSDGDASDWLAVCLFTTWLQVVASSGNFLHVLAISVDRFLAIKTPVFYRNSITRRRTIIAACSLWSLILLSTTLDVAFGRNPDLRIGVLCIWSNVFNSLVFQYMLGVPYLCTSLISTCLYLSVGYMVKKRTKRIGPVKNSESQKLLQQRKVTKMMALVVVTYYGLFLPAAIENYIQYDVTVKFYVSKALILLFFTNALINPFIYNGQSTEFNTSYRKILRLKTNNQLDLNKSNVTQIHSVSNSLFGK